jgi:hypothetical protein
MRADRILGRGRFPELALLGERQLRDVGEPARLEGLELVAVESRALEEIRELDAVALAV